MDGVRVRAILDPGGPTLRIGHELTCRALCCEAQHGVGITLAETQQAYSTPGRGGGKTFHWNCGITAKEAMHGASVSGAQLGVIGRACLWFRCFILRGSGLPAFG